MRFAVLIQTPLSDEAPEGLVRVFAITEDVWLEERKLLPDDPVVKQASIRTCTRLNDFDVLLTASDALGVVSSAGDGVWSLVKTDFAREELEKFPV